LADRLIVPAEVTSDKVLPEPLLLITLYPVRGTSELFEPAPVSETFKTITS